MKLEKAIEIKCRTVEEFLHSDPDDIYEADRLVIEAGKWREGEKKAGYIDLDDLLPGETKD